MSHELRTPLNAILMGLQMALEQTSAQSSNTVELARRQVLVETEVACDAAVDILNEFLLFDKLENGALALFKESVSILDLVRSSVQMFALQMRAKEISFTVENNGALLEDWQSEKTMDFVSLISHPVFMGSLICPPDELDDLLSSQSLYAKDCIQVDKSKVIRVLRNVLSNAIKFTPHTGNISLNMRFECSALQETLKASSSTGSIFSLQRWTSSKKLAEVPRCSSAKGLELGTVARPTTLTTPARTRKSMTTFNEGIRGSSNQFEGDYKKLMSSTFPSLPTISKQKSGADFLSVTAPAALCVPELNTRNKKVTDQQSVTSVDGWLVLELTDDGAGISSENQKKLFKEVIQFHPEKLQGGGGSGLGTMISKGIVELHGGNISVYSEGEGFGTTLTVRLPMTRRYDEVVVTSVGDLPLTETKPTHITSESSNRIHYGSDKKESVKLHPPQQTVEDNDTDTSLITPRLVMKPMSTESYTFSPFSEWSAPRGVAVHESKHRGQLRHSTSDVTIATPQTATTVDYCSALSNSSDDSAEKQGLNIEARNQGRYDCTPENLSDSDGPDSDKNLDQVTGESTPTTTTIATQRSLLDSKGSQLDKQTPCLLVLVVDDSALTRKMMVRLLDRRGHTSVEAADGLSALRMIQDSLAPGASKGYEPFDLVLIDNMMPVMNGVDATKEMRAVGFTGSIFGISGSVLDADVKAFRKAGVNLVLTKPIDMKLFQNGLACVISDKHNALVSTA